ncbi:hypothetical protein [Roseomonas sp. BN140053]|uniref:hypothetical protein n=1 Tax=Roseomonas sp. BN140053 TaxID=3391898 RepID=UPI0039E9C9B3
MSIRADESGEAFFSAGMLAAAFRRLGEVEDRMAALQFPATRAEAMERFDLLFEWYDARYALQVLIRAPEPPATAATPDRVRVMEMQD